MSYDDTIVLTISTYEAELLAAAIEKVLTDDEFRDYTVALMRCHSALGFDPGWDRIQMLQRVQMVKDTLNATFAAKDYV